MERIRDVLDGKSLDAASGRTSEVIDPSTGEVYATAPVSGAEDVDAAFAAAARAFETWRCTASRTTPGSSTSCTTSHTEPHTTHHLENHRMTPPPGIEQRRVLKTAIPGPRSAELHARKNAAVAAGVSTGLPVYVERAGGGILVDIDGNQLIDFGSGIAVTTVGNSAPRVVERVQAQVADFTHTCFMITPYAEYVEVAEALNELTPGEHEKRSALFNSGAEAVENAVKIARSYTGRSAIVAFDHAYHGRTNMTMALTAKNMPYKHHFGPFASEIYRVPMAYPFRWPTGRDNCADEAFATFTSDVHAQVGE
ncbi:MAG: aminotransferase class III-fold pyridoxal phosphate-dependent enzyme, partial [Actinoallomurus sp.]